jgi:predicted transcriptional regulator
LSSFLPKEKIERSEAILRKKRNTRVGLKMRNMILQFLYDEPDKFFTTAEVTDGIGSNYASVAYHLKNMLFENVVLMEKRERRNLWKITGFGQQTIKKWLENEQ